MASALFRTGSGPISSALLPSSVPLRHGSFSGCEKFEFSPLKAHNRPRISRALSEPQTSFRLMPINTAWKTFPQMLSEADEELCDEEATYGSLKFAEKCLDQMIEITAGGNGSGRNRDGFGSGRSSGGSNNNNELNKIGARYQKLLESSPNDPLLLRNYGKFLHEVEGDLVKAEECYGRAILASPGDGELMSLYGKLIWDVQRDGERAQHYFDQAVCASPNDCMVMGSYAQFMWEAEEDENIEEESGYKVAVPAA